MRRIHRIRACVHMSNLDGSKLAFIGTAVVNALGHIAFNTGIFHFVSPPSQKKILLCRTPDFFCFKARDVTLLFYPTKTAFKQEIFNF